MKRFLRALSALSVAAMAIVSLQVAPAAAAVPSNDDVEGAIAIEGLPATVEQDTTEATTSAFETEMNMYCGAPAIEQGVWYTYTATEEISLAAFTYESSFPTGIFMAVGSPDDFIPMSCAPGSGFVELAAGQTVYILVFGDGTSPVNSGQVVLNLDVAPAPPSIELTVDPIGYVDADGNATITGTFTCSSDGGDMVYFDLFGQLSQDVGRVTILGEYWTFDMIACDGSVNEFSAYVEAWNGKFAGGKAASITIAFTCNDFTCADAYYEADIQLRRSGDSNAGGQGKGKGPK